MQASDAFGPVQSPLTNRITELTCDPDWTLAHFAFVAHATTLEAESDIAHSPSMSVASSHHSLPLPRLAFLGDSPELLATYATFLVDPGTEIELMVNEMQRDVVLAAFKVQHIEPMWQIVFRGDPAFLDAGRATELVDNDLPSMQVLATSEDVKLRFVAKNPFEQGPAFGIWEKRKLIAMGTTNVRIKDAVQIGNIVAHGAQGEITAALVKTHIQDSLSVFAVVAQRDEEVLRIFKNEGFIRERPMYRMHCILE